MSTRETSLERECLFLSKLAKSKSKLEFQRYIQEATHDQINAVIETIGNIELFCPQTPSIRKAQKFAVKCCAHSAPKTLLVKQFTFVKKLLAVLFREITDIEISCAICDLGNSNESDTD